MIIMFICSMFFFLGILLCYYYYVAEEDGTVRQVTRRPTFTHCAKVYKPSSPAVPSFFISHSILFLPKVRPLCSWLPLLLPSSKVHMASRCAPVARSFLSPTSRTQRHGLWSFQNKVNFRKCLSLRVWSLEGVQKRDGSLAWLCAVSSKRILQYIYVCLPFWREVGCASKVYVLIAWSSGCAFVGPVKGEGYINSTSLLIPFFITPPLLWCFPKERQYLGMTAVLSGTKTRKAEIHGVPPPWRPSAKVFAAPPHGLRNPT
jgi:hypothetical protein